MAGAAMLTTWGSAVAEAPSAEHRALMDGLRVALVATPLHALVRAATPDLECAIQLWDTGRLTAGG
jgi:hypothetical protein